MKTPEKKERIMLIGNMQQGKTEEVVRMALGNQTPDVIEVFINYNTNESMESTNKKIKKYDVELYSGLEALKRFNHKITRKGLLPDTKYVLSLIAHWSSMEEVKKIITAYHTKYGVGYTFNLNIDEDDSLALDHSKKKGTIVQKQRLAQALIEMPSVMVVRNVSATPFAEHFSETDFDKIIEAPVGDTYVGIEEILSNAKEDFTEEDINSFSSLEPTQKAINYIQDEYEGSTLIQISKGKADHAIIAKNIMENCKKPHIVIVMNSDKSSYGCYVNGKGYGNKVDSWDSFKGYKLAEEMGIKKVFIVAYFLSDRTNTFRAAEGTFNRLRSLFHCSPNTNIETRLQRSGRLCGYPIDHIPQLDTTSDNLDYLAEAIEVYKKFTNIKEDVRLAVDRERVLKSIGNIPLKKIKHTNGYSNTAAQSYTITSVPVGQLITESFKGVVPDHINIDSTDLQTNIALANYFREKYNAKTVLNVTTDTKKRMLLLRPNQQALQAHRELAILFEGRNYKAIKQEHEYYTTKVPFALENMDGTYWQWNVTEGVSRHHA